MISRQPTSLLAQSLSKTENNAASTYVEFQKHFVKLNSLLSTNLEGIIMLQEALPGFFEL